MNQLIKNLDEIWVDRIKNSFFDGLISYERQLQAELYHNLKTVLTEDYFIWVEPVLYLQKYDLDKIKPDLVITNKREILAVIEIKHSPWSYANTSHDLSKFKRMKEAYANEEKVQIKWIPISDNWGVQKQSHENNESFRFRKDTISIQCVIAKKESKGLLKSTYNELANFRLYKGLISKNKESSFSVE